MKIQRPIVGAAVMAVAVTALITGCSTNGSASPSESTASDSSGNSSQPSPSDPPSRNASASRDCGSTSDTARASVTIANRTNASIFLKGTEVDCYDWDGTKNPTQFDNTFASPGTDIGPMTLDMKSIPELSGSIRPWQFQVTARYQNGVQTAGETLTGSMDSRPTYKFAKGNCYTTNGGITACSGRSLCADDPNLEKVTTTMPMRNKAGEVKATFDVVTACTLSDNSATIVFKGSVPAA